MLPKDIQKKQYIRVKPENVLTVWKCPKCKASEAMTPLELQEAGTPVCSDCDVEGVFQYVLVKKTSVRVKKK